MIKKTLTGLLLTIGLQNNINAEEIKYPIKSIPDNLGINVEYSQKARDLVEKIITTEKGKGLLIYDSYTFNLENDQAVEVVIKNNQKRYTIMASLNQTGGALSISYREEGTTKWSLLTHVQDINLDGNCDSGFLPKEVSGKKDLRYNFFENSLNGREEFQKLYEKALDEVLEIYDNMN